VKALFVTREYPPHIYGGAGVVVDQLTRAMGAAGRRRVEALFTWDRIAERTVEVYADSVRDFSRQDA